MSKGDGPLLLIGFRLGVLRALRELDRRAIVVVDRGRQVPADERIEAVREVDLHGPIGAIESQVRAALGQREPAAVLALAERTVVVAAHLRAALGLPGNSPATALACADKVVMKRAMDAAGVPVARWCELRRDSTAAELVEHLGLPLVIKPRRDSGGRQQRKLDDLPAVELALAELARGDGYDQGYGWLAEGWIDGVEMSVESFVRGGASLFANPTEYFVRRHANILPAQLPQETWSQVREFAAAAVRAVGVERGMTHLELFQTARGLVFGELAVRPPGGRLMQLIERAWGFDPWRAMLELELGLEPRFPHAPARCAGVWLLHPGAGTVRAVQGIDQARAVPDVRRVVLKVGRGDHVTERLGSGQDVCAVYAEAEERDAVARALSAATDAIHFELD
ncbi:ATP-grasp domain-containing protein [Engelhardtia mirabilis]|uniref:D-alanine--D-alanine ligase A n=1 Tax=Engelhardtia mirabilis TaxID=2528011 RepID=A0A518BMH8_9BACT|nr:D-alanine--D-alanine ligase A [Planctomycetes bacterium Pla133]QDV02483.1 D-alanine--D-alanine ligase A [Planctomycetes bacterium Pla86]